MPFGTQTRLPLAQGILTVLFLGILLLPGTLAAQPRPELPETRHDFGLVREDMALKHRFVVKNLGDRELRVLEIDPDCECTVASYDEVIPPGQEGQITLELKPFSVDHAFQKKTRVRFNDPGRTTVILVLQGVARKSLEIKPGSVIRLKGGTGGGNSAQVQLTSHLPFPWEITRVETTIPDKIELTLKTVRPGQEYLLTVKNKTAGQERYRGAIVVHSNLLHKPRLILRVFGDFSPEPEVSR